MTKAVSIHLPESLLVKVDAVARDRDDFFRHAIEEKIARISEDDGDLIDANRRNRIWKELDDANSQDW